MPIYISENGFITLTLSAIETSINYEASGLLLGYESGDTYYVETVIPYQLAQRTARSVSVSPRKRQRMRRVFKNYMKCKIIGEFHTHPHGDVALSHSDKKAIRTGGYELEIVVAIKKTVVARRWHYERGILSGTIDKYDIEIASWRLGGARQTKLSIRCPFAVGFDVSEPI